MRIRDRVKDAVRNWLGITAVNYQQVKHNTLLSEMRRTVQHSNAGTAAMIATLDGIVRVQSVLMEAELRRGETFTAAESVMFENFAALGQTADRILLLLEPQASKLHARGVLPPDWDAVQRENLKQFEEPTR